MSMFDKQKSGGLFQAQPKSAFGDASRSRFAAEEEPDPYDGLPPEERAERVLSEAEQAFRDRAKAEQARFDLVTDSEFWLALCFQSREQKEQFLAALASRFGLEGEADKYIDGWAVAKAMGIELDRVAVPYNTSEKVDKKWLSLAR